MFLHNFKLKSSIKKSIENNIYGDMGYRFITP